MPQTTKEPTYQRLECFSSHICLRTAAIFDRCRISHSRNQRRIEQDQQQLIVSPPDGTLCSSSLIRRRRLADFLLSNSPSEASSVNGILPNLPLSEYVMNNSVLVLLRECLRRPRKMVRHLCSWIFSYERITIPISATVSLGSNECAPPHAVGGGVRYGGMGGSYAPLPPPAVYSRSQLPLCWPWGGLHCP